MYDWKPANEVYPFFFFFFPQKGFVSFNKKGTIEQML